MTNCSFGTISERDMDRLFLESFITDPGFSRTIVDETDLKGKDFSVVSVELSKTENRLGESDITVIIEVDGRKHAILIEDKIDAIDMPEQHLRYKKRAEKQVKSGEYDTYDIFIFCPEKYYTLNDEAKNYEHCITYEKHLEYFTAKTDPMSQVRRQQLEQAITKAKKPPKREADPVRNAFFNKYRNYQKEHYPSLNLITKETSNGGWPHYNTRLSNVVLYHKMPEGYVDLTFNGKADALDKFQLIAEQLRQIGMDKILALQTGKSVALRIEVPKLDMQREFEQTPESFVRECLDAVQKLNNLANFFDDIRNI